MRGLTLVSVLCFFSILNACVKKSLSSSPDALGMRQITTLPIDDVAKSLVASFGDGENLGGVSLGELTERLRFSAVRVGHVGSCVRDSDAVDLVAFSKAFRRRGSFFIIEPLSPPQKRPDFFLFVSAGHVFQGQMLAKNGTLDSSGAYDLRCPVALPYYDPLKKAVRLQDEFAEYQSLTVLARMSPFMHESDLVLGAIHKHGRSSDQGLALSRKRPTASQMLMALGYGKKFYRIDPKDDPRAAMELEGRRESCRKAKEKILGHEKPSTEFHVGSAESRMLYSLIGNHCEKALETQDFDYSKAPPVAKNMHLKAMVGMPLPHYLAGKNGMPADSAAENEFEGFTTIDGSPGSSGGPVIDLATGHVIGVNAKGLNANVGSEDVHAFFPLMYQTYGEERLRRFCSEFLKEQKDGEGSELCAYALSGKFFK